MSKYVFIGSEAEGHYSGAYKCEGVVLPESVFKEYKAILEDTFRNMYFYELDGKHSEVKGDQVILHFADMKSVVKFAKGADVDFEAYLIGEELYGYIEDEELTEEQVNSIEEIAKQTHQLIDEVKSSYKVYTFYLTEEQGEKVEKFVESLSE